MNAPLKHHWWPQAFQQPWATEKGVITRVLRQNGKLVWKELGSKGIGFERELYSVNWEGFSDPQFIESTFFAKAVDEPAAQVLAKLNSNLLNDINTDDRESFSAFLILAYFRRADVLRPAQEAIAHKTKGILASAADFEEVYSKESKPGETKEQFLTRFAGLQRDILLNNIIQMATSLPSKDKSYFKRIQELHWSVVDLEASDLELLSSDNPMTLGLGFKGTDELILPISPKKLFRAQVEAGPQIVHSFSKADARKIVRGINTLTCQSAKKFILAKSLGAKGEVLHFIEKHFCPLC